MCNQNYIDMHTHIMPLNVYARYHHLVCTYLPIHVYCGVLVCKKNDFIRPIYWKIQTTIILVFKICGSH